jgi:hypothetical protein
LLLRHLSTKILTASKALLYLQTFCKALICLEMARIRTTAKLINESEAIAMTEMAPISEVMRESGIIEPKDGEEVSTSEKSNSDVEGDCDEEDPNILYPSKPSHIEFGKSTMKAKDLDVMKRLWVYWQEG